MAEWVNEKGGGVCGEIQAQAGGENRQWGMVDVMSYDHKRNFSWIPYIVMGTNHEEDPHPKGNAQILDTQAVSPGEPPSSVYTKRPFTLW